ncbi:MAG: hypothetical protein ACYC2I_07240 [Elusimicrobiales bacterium]
MAITCNFDKDDNGQARGGKVLVRIEPGQGIGSDTPDIKPSRNGAYLWVMDTRRRSGKSWRDLTSVN